ncbi:MAG TPA: SUMF1/EgtB/PvdO family nonheme iron enzyme [Aggregatilineales bacterium]|nr:SUMF1/EgtB/PvdO family nonheme iron enzyme [Aggregatilineales bacterium]
MSDSPNSARTKWLEQLDLLAIPAGTATLGITQEVAKRFVHAYGDIWEDFFCRETPQHEVAIASFELARYPVTNAVFAQFIAAGGYEDYELWTPGGWAWVKQTDRKRPSSWGVEKFAGDDRPVVGVSWYEAVALARWASIMTGENIRLPTEAEWEYAARVPGSRSLYPWGGTWDASRLNSGVADVGSPNRGTTTPVGMFSPAGDGPFGHADLLGQVWEWTSTIYRRYPYVADDGREDLYRPEPRILRGGNWSDGKYANRVTTRYLYPAFYADVSTGVRLARGGSRAISPRPGTYDLVLYGRSTFCPDLVKTQKWLAEWNIPYRQLNVDMDEAAAARLDGWLGSRTVPTFVVAAPNGVEPVIPPAPTDLAHLRNADRGSMLHEADHDTLRAFLIRNGFLRDN